MAGGKSGDSKPKRVKQKLVGLSVTQELNDFPAEDDGNQTQTPISNTKKNKERCHFCLELETEDVNIPSDAELECIVLTNNILANIYTDNDDVVQHNITHYSIYDENGHMCSLDSGVMERNFSVYMTGYVKPIYDNSPGVEQGIPVSRLGPILEWWLSLYDGGSEALIGITTEYAEYLLFDPHPKYKKYMLTLIEKIYLSREVIKNIVNNDYDDPTYADILNCVINCVNPATGHNFTEEDLISHAQFVINQVLEYDSNDTHHIPLADIQFLETLLQLSGAEKHGKALSRRVKQRTQYVKTDNNKRELSRATTTELVRDVFELNVDEGDKKNEITVNKFLDGICNLKTKNETPDTHINQLCEKMFVIVKTKPSTIPLIGCIQFFTKSKFKNTAHIQLFMHSYETVLGETGDPQEIFALKKCINIDIKQVVRVLDVVHKIPSKNWFQLGNKKLQDYLEPVNRKKNTSFFYQLKYDDVCGRFEYPETLDSNAITRKDYCRNCEVLAIEEKSKVPEVLEFIEEDDTISYFYKFKLFYKEYKVGSFIYLQPGVFSTASRTTKIGIKSFELNKSKTNLSNQAQKNVDERIQTEYYRKALENTTPGSNEATPDPFEIAEILAIYYVNSNKKNVKLIVRRMYRAEQIPLKDYVKNADMNMLFWSSEEFRVIYTDICGLCYVSFISSSQDPIHWSLNGPDRFYFTEEYDLAHGSIVSESKLPDIARITGKESHVGYNSRYVPEDKLQYIPIHKKIKPLRGLDIFAGCGGLSRGLEDSGLVITNWAIECDEEAASAFKLNNPKSTVFVEDCNSLLNLAMSDLNVNHLNQNVPQQGEVEFICGGPPCQGFSGMNRFNSGQYSLFKNSLIVTFLSYIDFYRPKYFVMENVRNFVSYKKSMILKLTLRCITRMGYQCTFGILQAGNFGVPQTRRRLIIMAAAPGEKLPLYPEPIHVFNRKSSSLNIQIGQNKFQTNYRYDESAPMRTVTVYDAWSDLPEIPNGANEEEIMYGLKPITHLQKILRYLDNQYATSTLSDHICKDMSHLVQARMELIPVCEGSDWRDLPNIEIKLKNGNVTKKLLYTHHDIKNGRGSGGTLRGVCSCASGEKCNPQDKQNNTIIPWCLPHTGNRHNNWAGLYGRLAWSGYCSTTITNPEPMGKQGRVLHPEQHRVVSVRECARSQGFKDSFQFYGSIINKHRQIGNAVPPPMGTAIGREIIKAMDKNTIK